ncbi:HlyD family efflux transporter periplasmic adaptor subunit [soil metagenome]
MNILNVPIELFSKTKNWFVKSPLIMKLLLIIIIAGIGWFSYSKLFASSSSKTTYETAKVEKGNIISTLTESGTVTAISQTTINSPTDGVISTVYVKNGDVVTAGQNLFQVKSTATPKEKATAYAAYLNSLNSAQSAVQSKQALQAQLESGRKSVLDAQIAVDTLNTNISNSYNNPATKQAYTQNEIESIKSTLTAAKQNFTATETKYLQADTSIAATSTSENVALLGYQATQDSIVTAPIAGTVANFSSAVGSNVSGSATTTTTSNSSTTTTTTGSGVLVLGDFSLLSIKAQANEVDVPNLASGQKATVTLDAFPDKTFVGTVSSVDTIGTSTSGVVTYNEYITLVSPPPTIHSGMTASAIIQTDKKDNVLKVPTTAIQTTDGVSTVDVMKNGQVSSVEVETGIADDTYTEIISGLTEGEEIVTSTSNSATATSSTTTSPFSRTLGGFGGGGATRVRGGQ